MTELETNNAKVAVFNIFASVCPPDDEYCYPDSRNSFPYRDKDHFNTKVSILLAESLVEMHRSAGTIAPVK